jgi:MFS superfamily sulfate permease-like transporter
MATREIDLSQESIALIQERSLFYKQQKEAITNKRKKRLIIFYIVLAILITTIISPTLGIGIAIIIAIWYITLPISKHLKAKKSKLNT